MFASLVFDLISAAFRVIYIRFSINNFFSRFKGGSTPYIRQMIRATIVFMFFLGSICCSSSLFAQAADSADTDRVLLDSASLASQRVYRSFGDGLLQPDSVFILDLSRQKRKEVPEQIRQFKKLQVLKLSRNQLRELPAWIGEFKNLQVLDVGYNKLKEIPASIGECRYLTYLGLNRNLIETLPKEIGNLELLQTLEMWDNEVMGLPDEIKYLHNLQVLELRGILFSEAEQDHIRSLLPDTDIYFSPSCNCKN